MSQTIANPFQSIFDAQLPADSGLRIRHSPRKEIAANIRALLRRLKIKGISVTAPNYSMAQSVEIRLPEASEHDRRQETGHDYATCPICIERHEASKYLEKIILAAFPDLDNRSDSQSDYFNYRLSIH